MQWINTLARGEAMLKYNFDVSMASIFDSISTASDLQMPKTSSQIQEKTFPQTSRSTMKAQGYQAVKSVTWSMRINASKKLTPSKRLAFDGTLDFKGQGSLSGQPRDFNALNNE